MGRKYKEKTINRLLAASAGRCTICNNDVMNDWMTHKKIATAEKAHIKAFSDLGPRADKKLSVEERNAEENLMILCPTCHSTIDDQLAVGLYTVDILKKMKSEKELLIRQVLAELGPKKYDFVKFGSSIGAQNFAVDDNEILLAGFSKGLFSKDAIINLSEDCNMEDINTSVRLLDDKFSSRVQRAINNQQALDICLFGLAPQPLLIYLGTKFNDKHNIKVFTKHRDKWVFDEKKEDLTVFKINAPAKKSKKNSIALVFAITSAVASERIRAVLGADADIWEVNPSSNGVDTICTQDEIAQFHRVVVNALDEIGNYYGKNVPINVFPVMCNSLAITLGRTWFAKSHNKLVIFDCINQNGERKFVERLTIE